MNKGKWKKELAKLKDMSWSDRIWYIWEYYKIGILAGIIIIFALYEIGACIYRNMQDTMLYCLMINEPSVTASEFASVQKSFEALEGFDSDWRLTTEFDSSLSINESSAEQADLYYSSASTIKLESLIATDTADVLITTPVMFEYYASQNLYMELDTLLPTQLFERLEAEGRLIEAKNFDGDTVVCAISLDNSHLSELIPLEDGSSIGICTDKNHPDVSIDFIEYVIWGTTE